MSTDPQTKEAGKTVLIPVDGSKNSEHTFQCKYDLLPCMHVNMPDRAEITWYGLDVEVAFTFLFF